MKQESQTLVLHHADFIGRTETLTTIELAKIAASGSTADIQFPAKPVKNSGTLDELRAQGKIIGFEYAWSQGMKKNKTDVKNGKIKNLNNDRY